MNTHQGKLLRTLLEKHFPNESIEKIAVKLEMTRQNLNYHLRKDILDKDFVRLMKDKLGFISLENGFSESITVNEPVAAYSKQIQIIDEKDLHPIMLKYMRSIEDENKALKRVISLQDEKISQLDKK